MYEYANRWKEKDEIFFFLLYVIFNIGIKN